MLQELHIQNLALIKQVQLHFEAGFIVLTGETGAGKSILLDGLGLVLGERADSALVRHGEERAEVSALFDITKLPQVQAWLTEQSLEDEDASCCILRRVVTRDGRSKAFINGRPVAANNLKTLGDMLVDIHGQHEHQSLLNIQNQLQLVDAYGEHQSLCEQTKQGYKNWQELNLHYQKLKAHQTEYQSKLELLTFQISEFDKIQPLAGEFAELSEEQNTLAHASEIKRNGLNSHEALDGEQGASHWIHQAIHQLEQLSEYTPALQSQLNQLHAALIDIQETANDIHHFAESIDLDPHRLEEVDQRLSQLYSLAKKYHLDPEELPQKHQQLQHELAQMVNDYGSLDELESQIKQAWSNFQAKAQKLSQQRQKTATKLAKTITESMQTLGMEKGQFSISIQPLEKPNSSGMDRLEFLVAANPGQPAKPLAKVASGGELSRISLAIQVASAEVAKLPTLIFDEVDVGIGGGIAEVVGKKMRQLGQHCQVLSITHLGQVAAWGQQHLTVQKQTQSDQTHTQVTILSEQARVEEVARMIGGLTITEHTLTHAKELIERAH